MIGRDDVRVDDFLPIGVELRHGEVIQPRLADRAGIEAPRLRNAAFDENLLFLLARRGLAWLVATTPR